MNINNTKYVTRILPAGAMALSVAGMSSNTMKFNILYENKQY